VGEAGAGPGKAGAGHAGEEMWQRSSQGILPRAASRRAELAGILPRRPSLRRRAPVGRSACRGAAGRAADVCGRCVASRPPADERGSVCAGCKARAELEMRPAGDARGRLWPGGDEPTREARRYATKPGPSAIVWLLRVRQCQIRGRRRNYMVSHLIKSSCSRQPQTHFFAGGVCGISGRRPHFHPERRIIAAYNR
jgi:hypothetical protein